MSYWTTTIYGIDIYLGFDLVKDLEVRTVKQILDERQLNGKYKSLENFILRTGVSETQISILIRIGAFNFTKNVKTNMQGESLYISSEIKDRSLPVGLFDQADVDKKRCTFTASSPDKSIEQRMGRYFSKDVSGFQADQSSERS